MRETPPPVAADEVPDFRRLAVRIFFINMLVIACAYSLYWYWVANAVETEISQWLTRQRHAGQTLEFDRYRRGGFPLAVTLTFEGVRYAPDAADSGWSYRVDEIALSHPITAPSTLGIALKGSQELVLGHGAARVVYAGGFAAAAGTLRAGGWLPNGEAEIHELALIDAASGAGLAVGALALTASGDAAAPASADETGLKFAVDAGRLALPGVAGMPFGPEIAHLLVEGEVKGALPRMPAPDLLDAWREAGGALELTRVAVAYGPVIAEGSGTLTLSADRQPEAAFSLMVEGVPQLVDRLRDTGVIDGATAAKLQVFAALAAKTGPDGKTRARIPVSVQEGEVSVGPVPLATLPVIRWRAGGVTRLDGLVALA